MHRSLYSLPIFRVQRSRLRDCLRLTGLIALTGTTASLMSAAISLRPLAASRWLSQIQPRNAVGLDPVAQAIESLTPSGSQIRLNGHLLNGAWQQQAGRIGVNDTVLMTGLGINLLDTQRPDQQPIDWFSPTDQDPLTLPAWHDDNSRYLDITALQAQFGWTVQSQGNVLAISTPASQIMAIRKGRQSWGERLVIDLDNPIPWQIEQTSNQIKVILPIAISTELINQVTRSPSHPDASHWLDSLQINQSGQRTIITVTPPAGINAHSWSLTNPNRLVIDFRADTLQPRDIQWAPHLRWQQQYLALGSSRFPVYTLTLTPGTETVSPLPIWANPTAAPGVAPLLSMGHQWQAAAAINGGFFNRNNKLPLGALRYNNRWISGPILGRGAIAWNDQGETLIDRLALTQIITTQNGASFPVLTVNSGYVQAGIGRYTPDWGSTYTSLIDNEIIVTVRNQRVEAKQQLSTAGNETVPIPTDGYLLALRAYATAGNALQPGTDITLSSQAQPNHFDQYSHVLGAGPLLIRQQQIVLDPVAEGFSQNFIEGAAPRSAIGILANGQWRLVTIQNRIGGRGPTLAETAQIMQQLGAVDALNLDGGSSTSLYLNGLLLNRPPRTAARIHNGLGLFLSQPNQ